MSKRTTVPSSPDDSSLGTNKPTARASAQNTQFERERLIALFSDFVAPLRQAFGEGSEVVLHDLSKLPNSIVAVHGDVTGRKCGDPATDVLLEYAAGGHLDHMVGYTTRLPDGRMMRSTTLVIRDSLGAPIAALCVNSDLTAWQAVHRLTSAMLGEDIASGPLPEGEVFARDVDELAAHLVEQAIVEQGVPVGLMRKEHKLAVVRALKARGMFMLRDAVEMIAASLQVTRFTIYNYLNEIGDEPDVVARNERDGR